MPVELSVLIPVKNMENELPGLLRFFLSQCAARETEFFILDMGSQDATVWEGVQLLKEYRLHGCVIQNGEGAVPAALNTGLQRASGEFLCFGFARRLYRGCWEACCDAAEKTGADLVFGCAAETAVKQAERRMIQSSVVKKPSAGDFLKERLKGTLPLDLPSLLVRRSFLQARRLRFWEEGAYGYQEDFLLRCLAASPRVTQAPVLLVREEDLEWKQGKTRPAGEKIFQLAEAPLRLLGWMNGKFSDAEVQRCLLDEALPRALLDCAGVLQREGLSVPQVKRMMREKRLYPYLAKAKPQDPALRKQVFAFCRMPWLYRPSATRDR